DRSIIHRYFFFQAEDGIRDRTVTGVQTCALPIYRAVPFGDFEPLLAVDADFDGGFGDRGASALGTDADVILEPFKVRCERAGGRSEERRVGIECGVRR